MKYVVGLIIVTLVSFIGIKTYLPSEEHLNESPQFIVLTSGDTSKILKPEAHYGREAQLVTQLLQQYHFRKTSVDDSLSAIIFKDYIESYDNNKVYFLKSDLDTFEKFRFRIDDDLKAGRLEFPYQLFEVFKARFFEKNDFVMELLGQDFDFSLDEYYDSDRTKAEWPRTENEQNEVWRKILKAQLLNHKLTGKDIEESKEILRKRYEGYRKAIAQYSSEDIFQQYLNSFTQSYDPHTNYFSPVSAQSFMIDLNLSLEGIGARLTTDGDYTIIANVVAGGPAFKSNMIHENDKITGVAQGDEEKFVDVIGWRVTDVVKLIRGPKGSIVRLQVIPAGEATNAIPIIVRLIREKIQLEDEKVTSEVIPINKNGKDYKLGVITVPSFYFDYDAYRKGDMDFNSTSRDVRKILGTFNEEAVNGVLIDLRRNGGGSLQEAIDLTGLFIKDGPVVQVRSRNGSVEQYEDTDRNVVWEGPLAVLTNRFSASASEIFSGAIQDYQRGVIIGEQTYGKGTVQNMIDLSRFMELGEGKAGEVKLTQAKFYRINGNSTQLKGVTPDVNLPSAYDASIFGEGSKPTALKYDEIQSAKFSKTGKVDSDLIARLNNSYLERLENDPELKGLQEEIKESNENRNNTVQSLKEDIRKKELEEMEQRRAARAKLSGAIVNPESKNMKLVEMHDPYLKEGLLILAELVSLNIG